MSRESDVLVIGAGVAGLAAARVLCEHDRHVAILEARDRLGERICTRHDNSLPVPVELGAEFLHGMPEETFSLVRRAMLTAVDINGPLPPASTPPGNFSIAADLPLHSPFSCPQYLFLLTVDSVINPLLIAPDGPQREDSRAG